MPLHPSTAQSRSVCSARSPTPGTSADWLTTQLVPGVHPRPQRYATVEEPPLAHSSGRGVPRDRDMWTGFELEFTDWRSPSAHRPRRPAAAGPRGIGAPTIRKLTVYSANATGFRGRPWMVGTSRGMPPCRDSCQASGVPAEAGRCCPDHACRPAARAQGGPRTSVAFGQDLLGFVRLDTRASRAGASSPGQHAATACGSCTPTARPAIASRRPYRDSGGGLHVRR